MITFDCWLCWTRKIQICFVQLVCQSSILVILGSSTLSAMDIFPQLTRPTWYHISLFYFTTCHYFEPWWWVSMWNNVYLTTWTNYHQDDLDKDVDYSPIYHDGNQVWHRLGYCPHYRGSFFIKFSYFHHCGGARLCVMVVWHIIHDLKKVKFLYVMYQDLQHSCFEPK